MLEQDKIFNKNIEENEIQKSKKFVFQISHDNVEFIETLSYQEKNDLVNYLLEDYRATAIEDKKNNADVKLVKKIVAIVIAVIVGIPLVFYLTGVALDLTKNSYFYMQKNFEKLYH